MREIKFRGKDINGARWWYGSLAYFPDSQSYHIIPCGTCKNGDVVCDFVEVQAKTVGQFTGLYDKDGNEIYEDDIVQFGDTILNAVEFRHGSFGYQYHEDFYPYGGNRNFCFNPCDTDHRHKVIGNIHDNPEIKLHSYERP